jgi:hypothetical protein
MVPRDSRTRNAASGFQRVKFRFGIGAGQLPRRRGSSRPTKRLNGSQCHHVRDIAASNRSARAVGVLFATAPDDFS